MGVRFVRFSTNAIMDLIKECFFVYPYWRSDYTCNLFLWDEDLGEKYGNADGSIMNSKLEVMVSMGYMKTLYEESRKKNKNLKTKLKT